MQFGACISRLPGMELRWPAVPMPNWPPKLIKVNAKSVANGSLNRVRVVSIPPRRPPNHLA